MNRRFHLRKGLVAVSSNVEPTADFDVVVVGGGAAGIAAAVGAARSGASVCVVEQYGFLGGAATNSSVLTHCGFFDQTGTQVVRGVGQQVLDRLAERRLYRTQTIAETGNTVVLLDLETTKSVYDQVIGESGVTLLLHSKLVGATTADGRITEIEIVHRGGHRRITGRAFVDCSGDGALIAESGSAMRLSEAAERQACTLVMRVGGVADDADLSQAGMAAAVGKYEADTGHALIRDSGIAVRMPVARDVMLLLADQHRDALSVEELTEAELRARELSWHYLDAFRRFLPGWEEAYLAFTGPQIGIREARRLRGVDAVLAEDVSAGRKRPDDAVARCGWPMENHVAPGVTEYGGIRDKGWYHISYGAIRSSSTDNLWAGGRLVSSDNSAYASLRVMGTSFATGHACGVAAAVYADAGVHDYASVRRELENQGALI
ncbi:hypothetical protein B1813_00210 [Saccharomonospora piscinae]|uniref:FAD dependent oxidoreductase n=1 Tax=Saccharomonospora piscinae TaxID=687388 RepID=A0A1V9ABY6_SACPI|nr:hypothetical protein B1813_00210 [Saccharomonospora piscinae]